MTTVDVAASDTEVTVTLTGAVDVKDAYLLPDAVYAALEGRQPPPASVIVDLAGVTFMDSTGLSMLLRTEQEVTDAGSSLVLRAPSETVRNLLRVTALDSHFTLT